MIGMKHAQLERNNVYSQEKECISLTRVKPLIKILILDQVPLVDLLAGTDIAVEDLTLPDKRIVYAQYHHLAANACYLSKNTSFALRLGEQIGLHHDDVLIGRIMSSDNVEQSMELFTRYQSLFTKTLKLEFSLDANGGELTLRSLYDLKGALPYFIEYTMAVIYSLGRLFLGGLTLTPDMAEIDLSYPQPESIDFYQEHLSVPISFNQPTNKIKFSRALLDRPLVFSNRESAHKRDRICQARVNEIAPDKTILDRVKFIIHKHIQSNPSLEQVADSLCIAPRTLRRHLHMQNTSYKELVEAERKRLALIQIKKPEISIETVATNLGYGDASSFSRAFKRWYGVSPKRYR